MTTAEQIGRDYVEAIEEVQTPSHYFNEDCNEYLKTHKGLQMLLNDYCKGDGCSVDYPVEFAIHQEHLMWGWPLFE